MVDDRVPPQHRRHLVTQVAAEDGQLLILPADRSPAEHPEPRARPVLPDRAPYPVTVRDGVVVLSTYTPGGAPKTSGAWPVESVECGGELSYWAGFSRLWDSDQTIVNVERDMQFDDALVAELVDCPHPLCAYPYRVYPTAKGKFIYCGTATPPGGEGDPVWLSPGDEWAVWHSIGFCKITPQARVKPLDAMFWQWLEHSINRVVCRAAGLQWHVHWPEIRHYHDYEATPDHLW